MSTVQVLLDERSYPIRIEAGSLHKLGTELVQGAAGSRVIVLASAREAATCLEPLVAGLESVQTPWQSVEVPGGERMPSVRSLVRLYDGLLEVQADRETLVVGLGGTSVCHLATFAASTWRRGLPLVLVPTSLLAQVDASVGGRACLQHRGESDAVGMRYAPRLVWIDPSLLAALPPRELQPGLIEIVKLALIWDAELFGWLESHAAAVRRSEAATLVEAITRACQIKAELIGGDRNAALRTLLTFGRPPAAGPGPAAEPRAPLPQGLLETAAVSEQLGVAPAGCADRLATLLLALGLPAPTPDTDARAAHLCDLAVDKRERDEKLELVVLRDVGRAERLEITPDQIFQAFS